MALVGGALSLAMAALVLRGIDERLMRLRAQIRSAPAPLLEAVAAISA
ncbi:MAG: hypothetical protein ISS15_19360 [Alphaproteobacteria bacterium]|nr:hypothetical protein [Alphaproteobacteria bacterium]MBL6939903.1 hypothetical protein [Alphaproteobacteria bacterium]MBL7099821.1 hypothetical protein [Alphaproteobacteria bacterium]